MYEVKFEVFYAMVVAHDIVERIKSNFLYQSFISTLLFTFLRWLSLAGNTNLFYLWSGRYAVHTKLNLFM